MSKNILLILCDQLSATALESYGNTYNDAPNIRSIAESGTIIDNTYTTCPLCQPARASLWTSLYPHQTNVLSNLPDQGFDASAFPSEKVTMGDLFSKAGYECMHFGKEHDYGTLRGFKCHEQTQIHMERENEAINYDYETYLDENTTRQVVDYFENDVADRPFFAVADLQNPHNICGYIGENENGHKGFGDNINLPDLPDNYHKDMPEDRPAFIQYLCCAHRRQSQTAGWREDDFRHYLYAYHYYISIVDKQIGRILEALEASGKKDETLIVFVSDHGEGMAGHGLVTKYGAFYDETNRIPLFFSGKGIPSDGRIKGVASIIDIFPTLLDYAGLDKPDKLEGISLFDQITGKSGETYRDYAIGEWYDEFRDYRVPGRMYVDDAYKYMIYNDIRYDNDHREKQTEEELYDMTCDRIEMKSLAYDDMSAAVIDRYRHQLETHMQNTNDSFSYLSGLYDVKYRQHTAGCSCHEGPNAVLQYAATLKK